MQTVPTRYPLRALLPVCAFSICSFVCDAAPAPDALPTSAVSRIQATTRLPLSFEANRGQADARARFLANSRGPGLFLTDQGAVMALSQKLHRDDHRLPGAQVQQDATPTRTVQSLGLHYAFSGANKHPKIEALDPLPGHSNYFIGNDPKHWRTDIAQYRRVRYRDVYPGVNVIYYGKDGQLEFDIEAAPGADMSQVRLRVDGADSLALDDDGNLQLHTALGVLRQSKPVVYQMIDGERRELPGEYVLRDIHGDKSAHEVAFRALDYDQRYAVVFDPTLLFSSLIGGSGTDDATAVAVDSAGNSYITGSTGSSNFPTTMGAYQTTVSGTDAFVTKISADGATLVYSTFLGGSGTDTAYGIAVDGAGNAYVAGYTSSTNFPTKNALQSAISSNDYSGFITALNSTGTGLIYSTYYGGSSISVCMAIAADSSGNAYVTGSTYASDLPATTGAFETTKPGPRPAFVAKLAPAGTQVYATYLGGSGYDGGEAIAIDSDGDAYVAGNTSSTSFNGVTLTALGTAGGLGHMLIAELNPTGSALVYATVIGGSGSDYATGIAVDGGHQAYFTGVSDSTNLPTTTPPQPTNGVNIAYIGHLDDSGTVLYDFTWYGTTDGTQTTGAAIDLDEGRQSLYVVGQIQSKSGTNSLGSTTSTNAVSGLDCASSCAADTGAFLLQYTINPLTLASATRATGGSATSNAYFSGVTHTSANGYVAAAGSSDGNPPTTVSPHLVARGESNTHPSPYANAGGDDLFGVVLDFAESLQSVVAAKDFLNPLVRVGQSSFMIIRFENPSPFAAIKDVGIFDSLPACMKVLVPINNTCDGTFRVSNANTITISGIQLDPMAHCQVTFNVQGVGPTPCDNVTAAPTSSAGPGDPAQASLSVTLGPSTTYGGGSSGSMNQGTSWVGGSVPVYGSDILFPSGATPISVTNDLPSAQTFNQVNLSGTGYTLSGNTFNLLAGINNSGVSNTVSAPIKANLPLVFTSDPGGSTLNLHGGINLNGNSADFIGAGTSNISGVISGVGNVNGDGGGDVVVSTSPSFTGDFNVGGGTFFVNASASQPANVSNVGTLRGTGPLGAVTINDSGNVYPGTNSTPVTLSVASLTVNSGIVELAFAPSNASHSAIHATGAVHLIGGTLELDLVATPTVGTVFSNLITAPGTITGCFAQAAAASVNVGVIPHCTASEVSATVVSDVIFKNGFDH